MDFPMAQAPLDPISLGVEQFLTPPGTNANIMRRNMIRHHPMYDYDFLRDWRYPIAITQLSG